MKRLFSLLALCLLLNTTWLSAQTVSVWDGTAAEWTHGSGTYSDPYLIESAQNLAWIAEMVNGGISTYANVYFKLTTDLNMKNIAWVPIGNSTTNLFCGKFDGDNHFIDSISITGSYTYKGLFGITGAGFRCENLGVNTNISYAGVYGGGIIAYINSGNPVIHNCYNIGTVIGKTGAGGIVGYAYNCSNVLISSCYNSGNISSTGNCSSDHKSHAGGIVGSTYRCDSVIISSCYNKGTIASSVSCTHYAYSYSGGIIGHCANLSGIVAYEMVTYCYNDGTISSYSGSGSGTNSSSESHDSYSWAGGITVHANTISYCYNAGNISSSSNVGYSNSQGKSIAYSGGIAASASSLTFNYNTGTISSTAHTTSYSYAEREAYSGGICGLGSNISNNYNRGDVKAYATYGSTANGTRNAGGIAGKSAELIENCYNTGTLTGSYKGGICGSTNCVVTNCYYINTCGGYGSGTAKTEAVMKSSSFPVLLNADSIVYVMDGTPNVNSGYPIFGDRTYALTQNANQVSFHSAILNGFFYGPADVIGFEYKKSSDSKYTTVYANVVSPATYHLIGLQSGETYNYRFFLQKNGLTIYGENKTFTTQACDLQATVTKSAADICAGQSATFTAAGSSNLSNQFTYEWNNGGTGTSIHVSDASTYTVTVHDTNGCVATASASVIVNPVPQGVISGNTTLCAGENTTLTASGANSYHWSTGATTPVITVNTSGTYSCTFTNSYGCTATKSATVNVFAAPVITGNTAICESESTTLTASGGSSYVWSNGSTSPSITVNEAGTYTVTATQGNCSASSNVTTTVISSPTPTITGNTSICAGESTTLVANGGYSYLWSNGSTSSTITVSDNGTYTVTASNAAGCTGTANAAVTVNPLPDINISGLQSICEGASSTLTASGANTYLWSNGSTNASLMVVAAGEYSVVGTNSHGCTNSATVSVTVNPVPQGVISGNTQLCVGENTTLTASGADSYLWSTGATSSAVTVNNSGTYSCTFTNGYGCSSSESVVVTAQSAPTITGNSSICQGQSTTLTADNGNSYLWSSGETSSSITVQNSGLYVVTASMGNCSATASINVTVNPLPNATILGNTILCQGQTSTLTANGGINYYWSDGSTTDNISVSQSGIYSVTATNAEGCSVSTNVTVTVNPIPNVNITGNSSFCQGDNTTLTATGANTYAWSNSQTSNAITVNNAGTYTVTGTDANGCTSTATKNVSVNPTYNIPLADSICEGESYNFHGQNLTTAGTYTHTLQTINGCDSVLTLALTVKALPTPTISGNTTLCEGESTVLTANGGVSYAWSNASMNNSISVSQSGVYSVTATNVEGCSASTNVTVTVNPLPTVTVAGNTTICAGNSTTLTASGADTYSWSTGDNTATVNINAFGVYTVTGTSSAGCSSTANVTVLVSQAPQITITGETDICAGENTTLTANGGTTYLWSNGTTDATLIVNNAGTYQVIGYSEAGCNAMASATVNVWQLASSEFSVECPDSCYTWNDQAYCVSGDYTQTLQTVHGCDSVVILHLTITVGIDDYDFIDNIVLYPNPASQYVDVRVDGDMDVKGIEVFDMYGKLVRISETTRISVSDFADGIYIVRVTTDKGVVTKRFVKNG